MKYYFLLIAVFTFGYAFAQPEKLSQHEKNALTVFLRVLTEDSEAGYVFFNQKPICIHGCYVKDTFAVNSDHHREAVAIKEGAKVWKKIKKDSGDILIHISQREDPKIRGYHHILIINVPMVHEVVNKNRSLFQYVLGPSMNSQDLLEMLVIEDEPFHALLQYDKVLIGILLGFGTQNSLYVSRMENILDSSYKATPPFLVSSSLYNKSVYNKSDRDNFYFVPSFGFKSAQDEMNANAKNLAISSEKLNSDKPNFIFGWKKNEIQNKEFISELESVQNKIQNLLNSPNSEITILEKIIGKNELLASNSNEIVEVSQTTPNKEENNKIVAKALWEFLQHDTFDYLSYFIEGMDNPNFVNIKVERLAYFPQYLSDFLEAKKNLQMADSYFQLMHDNPEFQCIVPSKLYYKIGEMAKDHTKPCKGDLVTVSFSLFSPQGHYLNHGSHQTINLKNTVTGFAHGIQGMYVGETREIFIHPSLAYGFDSSDWEKCMYLKAIVTLEDVHNEISLPAIEHHDLAFLTDPEAFKTRERNYKNGLKAKGAMIGSHLRKSKQIDFNKIKDQLEKFYQNRQEFTPTTEADQEIINYIHWNIYWPLGNNLQ